MRLPSIGTPQGAFGVALSMLAFLVAVMLGAGVQMDRRTIIVLVAVGSVLAVGEMIAILFGSQQQQRDTSITHSRLNALNLHVRQVEITQQRAAMLHIHNIQSALLNLSLPYHKARPWDNQELDPLSEKARELEDLRLEAITTYRDRLEAELVNCLNTAIHLGIPVDGQLNALILNGVSSIDHIDAVAQALNRTINEAAAAGITL